MTPLCLRLDRAKKRGKAREGVLRRAGVSKAAGAESFFRAGEGEVAGGEIRGILRFGPIKSMVSWGLSPNEARWG